MARHASRPTLLVGALVVAALVAVALLLFGGGKDTVPLGTVAEAAEATNSAGGFKVEVNGRIKAGDQEVPLKARGEMDANGRRGHLVFDNAGLPGAAPGGGGPEIEQIIDGSVIYMKMPVLTRQLGGDKPWLRLDYEQVGKQLGIDISSLQQGNNDPRRMLAQLKAVSGEVEKLGSEDVRGEETTHYKATIDLRKTPDALPEGQRDAARASIERLIDITGSSTYPMEVWIDGQKRVRRMRLAYEFDVPSQEEKADFEMTMELFDFGTQVAIEPPPAGEIQEFSELAKKLQESGAQGGQAPGGQATP